MGNIMKYADKCCGCHACELLCPSQAIRFYENKEGFFYPTVNTMTCTSCGQCEKVCPMEHPLFQYEEKTTYAAFDPRDDEAEKGSDGGLFGVLAQTIMREGGVVCGCAFDEQMVPRHVFATTRNELEPLKRAKYVESDISGIYPIVRDILERGRSVLFVGTPCQVGGLRAYLSSSCPESLQTKLYLVDVVCSGVPSRKTWLDHVSYLEEKYGGKMLHFSFDDKSHLPTRSYRMIFERTDGTKKAFVGINETDSYLRAYGEKKGLRPSCYSCPYRNDHRPGDITLGSFLGAELEVPEADLTKGLSLLLVNTTKGTKLMARVFPVGKKRVRFASAQQHNPALQKK